jgi:hypothetical protein
MCSSSTGFRRFRVSCGNPFDTSSAVLEYFRLLSLSPAGPADGVLAGSSKLIISWFTCMEEVLGASSSSSSLSADMEMSESESSFSRTGAPLLEGAWASLWPETVCAGVDSSELESVVDASVSSMAIWTVLCPFMGARDFQKG